MEKSNEQGTTNIKVVNEPMSDKSFTALKVVTRTLRKIPNKKKR